MEITKRNGNVVLFDSEKVKNSILKANAESHFESISEGKAAAMAQQVFDAVSDSKNQVKTTQDVTDCVCAILKENLYLDTAAKYLAYAQAKAAK